MRLCTAKSAANMAELQEVLESETHVDMEKLVSLAQHQGVPDELRAEAWKYMLGVARPERAEEMSLRKRMEVEFKDIESAWRSRLPGEVARTVKVEVRPHSAPEARTCARLESVLCAYLHTQGEELRPGTVHLLWPFVHIYSADAEAYYCFTELMKRLEWSLTFDGCKQMQVCATRPRCRWCGSACGVTLAFARAQARIRM